MKTIIVVSLLLLNIHLAMSATKGVTASLKAKWSMTPFLLETRYATVEMYMWPDHSQDFNVEDMIPLNNDCCFKRNVLNYMYFFHLFFVQLHTFYLHFTCRTSPGYSLLEWIESRLLLVYSINYQTNK